LGYWVNIRGFDTGITTDKKSPGKVPGLGTNNIILGDMMCGKNVYSQA